ncbi:DUF3277 family protein [Chromobacterium haemolyticum]|nr:DUF3277 family protein [Chromobacterium haemolyticum]
MSAYSFMDVSATFVGPGAVIDLGYGSASAEEGITITGGNDKNTMTIGADGTPMHSLHADSSGQITVRLLKTSPVNQKLMAAYDTQRLSSAMWGQNVITISLSSSGDQTVGRSVAFKKRPDINYKKDGDIIEWTFDAGQVDSILGTF